MVQAIRSREGHRITWVAGRDAEKLDRWSRTHQVDHVTTDFERVIESPDVDIVYVALPPAWHATWSLRAMQQGKRVLCEKPLGLDASECEAMLEGSKTSGLPLSHATGFVHHPRSHAMRGIVRSGELGEIRRVTVACSFSSVTQRGPDHRLDASAGGGCLLDLGWYCAFATLWFTGLRPTQLNAFGQRADPQNPSSVWTQMQTMARLEQGAIASWDCGYDAAGRKWIEIAGDKASLICDDFLRPWDLTKPRFWVHGQDGKARAESVGEGVVQESFLIHHAAFAPLETSLESLSMALEVQSILDRIEQAAK
jgi:predicted dehydrogenase